MSENSFLEKYAHFAIIVDGEVASRMSFDPIAKDTIAALSSNPVIVPISTAQFEQLNSGDPLNPWTYDGKNFVAPAKS